MSERLVRRFMSLDYFRSSKEPKPETIELNLVQSNIDAGYIQLPKQVSGTEQNNVVTTTFFVCTTTDGGIADYNDEVVLMRSDDGTADFLVWKDNVTPVGCSNASSISNPDFGSALTDGTVIQLSVLVA